MFSGKRRGFKSRFSQPPRIVVFAGGEARRGSDGAHLVWSALQRVATRLGQASSPGVQIMQVIIGEGPAPA